MAVSWIKGLTGTVDGANTTFFIPAAYLPVVPDSEAVFVRTLLRRKDYDDGWTVVSYTTGEITLNEAPLPGDIVDAFFQQDIDPQLISEGEIIGVLEDGASLAGNLGATSEIVGCLEDGQELCGTIEEDPLTGEIVLGIELAGIIEEC